MAAQYHTVTFLPENKTIRVAHLKTIFETIGEANPGAIRLFFSCGAEGICQKCKVRSLQRMGPLTATEKGCLSEAELARGIRLACQARVVQDTQVEIQYKRPFTIELADEPVNCAGPPRLRKIAVPTAAGQHPDADMLLQAACAGGIAVSGEAVSTHLAAYGPGLHASVDALWTAVFLDGRLIALEPGDTRTCAYAAAVDLGTNTLVISLIDAVRGRKIAVVTDSNPQLELGDTYEARLAMVEEDELNLEILNEEVILRIDVLIGELCAVCAISPARVYEILVAGATGMLHLFLMKAPGPLEQRTTAGVPSFERFTAGKLEVRSVAQAGIALMPVISAYAGADITAAILATGLHRSDGTTLLLDFGGSTKAVLYLDGRLYAAVTVRTAVLDGSGLRCGMRPETGAVAGVRLSPEGDLELDVIGESLPRGVCGRGLLELVACLRTSGMLDARGHFVTEPDACAHGLRRRMLEVSGEPAVLLYRDTGEFAADIYVTQQDILKLRQVRARVAAMLSSVCAQSGIACMDICRVFVSGALGGDLPGRVLCALGFIPAFLEDRIICVGNASKRGVQLALLDARIAEEADELARSVECVAVPDHEPLEQDLHF